jgi:hypothetical protein
MQRESAARTRGCAQKFGRDLSERRYDGVDRSRKTRVAERADGHERERAVVGATEAHQCPIAGALAPTGDGVKGGIDQGEAGTAEHRARCDGVVVQLGGEQVLIENEVGIERMIGEVIDREAKQYLLPPCGHRRGIDAIVIDY